MGKRPSPDAADPPPRPAPAPSSSFAARFPRLIVAVVLLGVAYGLGTTGRNIGRTGRYDYVLESHAGGKSSASPRRPGSSGDIVHTSGRWAREQAIGFMAASATLAYWSAIMLLGAIVPFRDRLVWTPRHSAMMMISIAGCLVATCAFFPPWRILTSRSSLAFYLVVAASGYLATIRDPAKLRSQSAKVFPALIFSAAVASTFSPGYAAGIVAGIFLCLLLAFQIAMLIPRVREALMKPLQGHPALPVARPSSR